MTEDIRCAAGFPKTRGPNPFWHGSNRIGENNSFLLRWSLSRSILMITIRIAEPNGALLNFTSFWKKGQFWSDKNSASADQLWGTRFLSVSPFPRELSHYTANSTGYQKNAGVNFPTLLIQKQQKEKCILEPIMTQKWTRSKSKSGERKKDQFSDSAGVCGQKLIKYGNFKQDCITCI